MSCFLPLRKDLLYRHLPGDLPIHRLIVRHLQYHLAICFYLITVPAKILGILNLRKIVSIRLTISIISFAILSIACILPVILLITIHSGIFLLVCRIIPFRISFCILLFITIRGRLFLLISIQHIRIVLRIYKLGLVHPKLIFLLLRRCQRLIAHFQFHGLHHIFSVIEPEDQLITLIDTLLYLSGLFIKICQLQCPLLFILLGTVLLQDRDLILQRSTFSSENLIFQNQFGRILGRGMHKILIILNRLIVIFQSDAEIRETIRDHTSHRCALICHHEQIPALLIFLIFLINISNFAQSIDTAHALPVNIVSNLQCSRIVVPLYELINLIQL